MLHFSIYQGWTQLNEQLVKPTIKNKHTHAYIKANKDVKTIKDT